jgi:5'-nucleotidase (lipoprotein e(P4) family)
MRKIYPWFTGVVLVAMAGCVSRSTEPLNLTAAKEAVLSYVDSGEYQRQIAVVAAEARAHLERRTAARKPGEELAVVFDLDETLLSNLPHMRAMDFGYVPELWNTWVAKADAEPIAPVVAVYRAARKAGVDVFFITGRRESDRSGTEKNLGLIGCGDYRELVMKPDGVRDTTHQFKKAVRQRVTEQGYMIIANIGDQQSDLEGGYAERTFKLPDPFYIVK